MRAASDVRAGPAGLLGRPVEGPIRADVVVIGGGLAGSAAALAARAANRTVALVRRSWGATALAHGLLDLAPDPLASPTSPRGEGRPIRSCIRALARRRPEHPWALLESRMDEVEAALADASRWTGGRLAFAPLDEENRLLLTPLGCLKATAGGWDGVLQGDLRQVETVGVVGFGQHPLFDAELLAAALGAIAPSAGLRCRALPVRADLLHHVDDFALRPHQLAARLEQAADRLVESVRRALPAPVDLLLLPPLLGRSDPRPLLATLAAELGVPCAELPAASTAPLQGLRLQRLLEATLEEAGVTLLHGEALARDGTLQVHEATAPVPDPSLFDEGQPNRAPPPPAAFPVEAEAVVLATGRFVGGGLCRVGRLRERVYDLPVAVDGRIDDGAWPGDLTHAAVGGEQPAFRAGIRVDPSLRPLGRDGRPVASHLFAAGAILAGNDPAADGAGLGLSWCTGWLAGRAAAGSGG